MTEHRSPVGRLMGAVVPQVMGAVDVDALVESVDLDALMQRIDIDALLTRIDIDALLTRIDIEALLGRIDMAGLLARIDLNEVVGQIDLNVLLADVDLNALMDGVDIKAIVDKAGIDQIVAEASTGVITRTLDLARRQLVGIDVIIMGAVDRLFRRPRQPLPDIPKVSATGRSAGPISRLVAFGIDLFFVSALFSVVVYFGRAMVGLFTGDAVDPSGGSAPLLWTVSYFAWFGVYLWGSIEIAGRTPGKALVGLRVADLEGEPLGPGRAFVRTLVFPFSFILGLGFIPAVTRRDRRALHELVAGCKEIVDWGDRQAGIPSALEGWVERQREAQVVALAPVRTPAPAVIDVSLELTPSEPAEPTAPEAALEVVEVEAREPTDEPVAAMVSTTVLTEPVDPGALTEPDAEHGAAAGGEDDPDSDYWAG